MLVPTDYISMYDFDMHSHVKLERFNDIIENSIKKIGEEQTSNIESCQTLLASYVKNTLSNWSDVRRVMARVHKHVCGHASYADIKTLLERNNLWNEQSQLYVSYLIEECNSCKAVSPPHPNRRVSLSSLNRDFNDIVCLDHFF